MIVCERTGCWAAALRRELGPRTTRVDEVRSLAQTFRALDEAPASFLVVELNHRTIARLLDLVADMPRWYPLARLAAVSHRSLAGYGPLVRESGAVWFTCRPRQLGPLAEVVRRHLAEAPRPQRGLHERLWARLPWGASETGGL